MKLLNLKVYYWFGFVAFVVLIIGIFTKTTTDSALDINVHDTYYVISYFDLSILLFISYFLFGLGYWLVMKLFNRKLINILTKIHSVIFIGGFIFYWIVYGYEIIQKSKYGLLYDNELSNIALTGLALLMIIATLIYFTNIAIGIFRKQL